MSYGPDRDPREVVVAVAVVTLVVLCYLAHWMAQTTALSVLP